MVAAAASSLVMVPAPLEVVMPAPLTPLIDTVKVSLASTLVSPKTFTSKTMRVRPASINAPIKVRAS